MIDLGQLPDDPQQRLLLLDVAEAAARLKALRDEVDQQRARLHDALLNGRAAGISERALARAAGVTPGRVHQITASRVPNGRVEKP